MSEQEDWGQRARKYRVLIHKVLAQAIMRVIHNKKRRRVISHTAVLTLADSALPPIGQLVDYTNFF